MTTATIPQTQTAISHTPAPATPAMPTELEILRQVAERGEVGATFFSGEAFDAAQKLVRAGHLRYFDTLGIGVPRFTLTPAGRQRLAALTRPVDGELRAALELLARTARENAARDFAEGNPVPRLRKARQQCAWLSREIDHKAPQFPHAEAFDWLLLAGYLEPVTTWLSGSKWTVGWKLTAEAYALMRSLRPTPIPATRALVVASPSALVVAGHFPPVPKPQPAPAPIPPASTSPTDPHWRRKLWKTSRVVVRGGRSRYYFIVYTPGGERHDSRSRENGLRIFYSAERAQKEGEAFEENWWLKHRWEASQTETLTHRGIEVKLRKLKYARGWWWRVDATVGEGLERTKKDAIAAAKADIADAEAYLRSKGYSI